MICLTVKPNQSFYTKQGKKTFFFFYWKRAFKEKEEWISEQKTKRKIFNCSRYGNQEGPHIVHKKVHEWIESPRDKYENSNSTRFKPRPRLPWLDYMESFTKQTNATSHPNIGSLKTAIEEEWNKISEEFILKACKSFWRRIDTIIEKKNGGHIE